MSQARMSAARTDRTDFRVVVPGTRVAVEIKRGATGAALREGIGQSLVYTGSDDYDFAVYLFVDTSDDKKIKAAMGGSADKAFVESLWKQHNVRFIVV